MDSIPENAYFHLIKNKAEIELDCYINITIKSHVVYKHHHEYAPSEWILAAIIFSFGTIISSFLKEAGKDLWIKLKELCKKAKNTYEKDGYEI